MKATIAVPPWATHVLSDLTDMERDPHPVDSRKVASFTLELPDDVYFEYAFRNGNSQIRADPENPARGANPWYPEVSVVTGPGYTPHPLADPPEPNAPGALARHRIESGALGQLRRVNVHTPAAARGPLPLVLVQDGTAYLRIAQLARVLDLLVERGAARPAHLAFLEPVDRSAEYGFGEPYRRFLMEELLPWLGERHDLTGETMLMGASLGGLLSMTVALERPDEIAAVATQSGAFLGAPDEREFYRTERSWIAEQLEARPKVPWRAYTETGTLEWLADVNRRVGGLLAERAPAHRYAERHAGHNWTNWRNGVADALGFLLAP